MEDFFEVAQADTTFTAQAHLDRTTWPFVAQKRE